MYWDTIITPIIKRQLYLIIIYQEGECISILVNFQIKISGVELSERRKIQ